MLKKVPKKKKIAPTRVTGAKHGQRSNAMKLTKELANVNSKKEAADASKRTEVAKTGVLDPVSMINYRWSEDIFLKNEIVTDGKSHGMVMFIDWSASMRDILEDCQRKMKFPEISKQRHFM